MEAALQVRLPTHPIGDRVILKPTITLSLVAELRELPLFVLRQLICLGLGPLQPYIPSAQLVTHQLAVPNLSPGSRAGLTVGLQRHGLNSLGLPPAGLVPTKASHSKRGV